tara:strand:- start:531 stop:1589 length:1059 start_codon:yes stop_codon:yes gene_type:complete
MPKEVLYNKKNKADLLNDLKNETFNRVTLSFYKYTKLNSLKEMRDDIYKHWTSFNILGRVYIAKEGINAQISIPENNLKKFRIHINSIKEFNNVPFKTAVEEGLSFLKLKVKIKNEIVAYNIDEAEYDISQVGEHLDYHEFNKAIDDGAIVIDMRNYYEGEVGKFENAIIPDVEKSNDLLPEIKQLLSKNKKNKIIMYCTGGIRCEKASSYLLKQGFEDVNQLKGGIIQYANDIKKHNVKSKFIGKNFVFDQRLGERITKDIISSCHICQNSCDTHTNCANQDCHILFIQCIHCKEKYNGCCSKKCKKFIALPRIEQQKLFKAGKIKFNSQKSNKIKPKLNELNNCGKSYDN